MRKISLFMVVAMVATMFTFAMIPVAAAGEKVEFTFDSAPADANYDYVLTVNTKLSLTSLLFTFAYPKADFTIANAAGEKAVKDGVTGGNAKVAGMADFVSGTNSTFWVRNDLTVGSEPNQVNTNSAIYLPDKTGNNYGLVKVAFNAVGGADTDSIPAGDLMKIYINKVGSGNAKVADSFKLVGLTNPHAEFGISKTDLIATGSYSGLDYGTCNNGVKLNVAGVAQADIPNSEVVWTNNVVGKIGVTDLTVAKDTVNLKMGATTEETVGVTIVPDNATDKTYSVESSASGVATAEVVAGGVKITAVSDGTANVTVTSNDNASAKKVIAVNVAKADPTNYTVTVNKTGLGIATVSAGSVAAGGTVDLRVLPVLGNKVSSITMNSQDITADFNAFLGGKKTYTINENTTFTVTFASIIGTEAEKPFVAPDAFVGEYTKPGTTGAQKSAAAFGKIAAPVASNLVTEYGVKLEKDGAPYTKEVGGVTYGPKFEATSNVNDQFGVLFIGLEAGTYTATTYVVYDNGGTPTEVEGYAVTFTVQ